jgi:conjugal transfer pilus assembly protein TraB
MAKNSKVKVDTIGSRGADSKKKLTYVAAGIVIVAIVVNAIMASMSDDRVQPRKDPRPEAVSITPDGLENESFESQAQSKLRELESRNRELNNQIQENQKALDKVAKDQQDFREDVGESFSKILKRLDEMDSGRTASSRENGGQKKLPPPDKPQTTLPAVPPPPSFGGVRNSNQRPAQPQTSAPVAQAEPKSKALVLTPPKSKEASDKVKVDVQRQANPYAGWLSSGFLPVTTLTGVQAGTSSSSQQNPSPMLMRVQGDVTLPGSAQYDLKGCFINGLSYGDARTHRAITDIATLSCVDKRDRLVLEEAITGYVVDSDGIEGLRGTLVERRGAILAKATLASMLEGLSNAFGDAQGTAFDTVTGGGTLISGDDAIKSSGLNAAATGARTLSDFYLKELERLFPVIEVPPNRKATVIITKGKSLKWNDAGSLFVERKRPQ